MIVTDLIRLGKTTLTMFDEYTADMCIDPPMKVYIRHFTTELEVSETACRSQGSSEIIQKPDWSKTVFDFLTQRIKPLPEFERLSQSIAKRYKNNIKKLAKDCNEQSQTAFWLETFVQRLIYEKLENKLSEDSLVEYASLFKSELELSPSEFNYVYHLDGIFLEAPSIRINDNVSIRKTQASDLEYTRDIFDDGRRSPYLGIPSSILEIDVSASDERDCYQYIDRVFNCLRLYKLGSIYSMESISTKKTAIWSAGRQLGWSNRNYHAFRRYTLTDQESELFVRFVATIEQKLDFNADDKEHRSLSVSMGRYNSALLESTDIDTKLMSAVMGLESLLTFEKDRGENAFKLAVRVARLLGNLGFDALKARVLIEEGYGFRNKVVHGSHISQENRKRMSEILPNVLNYLRVSMVVLLLTEDIGKDRMIELIDNATVSDTHNQELNKLISSTTSQFAKLLA